MRKVKENLVDMITRKLEWYRRQNNIVLTEENYDDVLRLAVSPEEYEACVIPNVAHGDIEALCAKGDQYAESGDFNGALKQYWQAWDLLPEPKTDYEAATWILAAVGDANFLAGDFEAGRDNLSNAMHYPDAIGNPFLHLRLGQCQFELGNMRRAADELGRAFLLGGTGLFDKEDPKYLHWIKPELQEPPEGWGPGY